jgi:hypothetical protein
LSDSFLVGARFVTARVDSADNTPALFQAIFHIHQDVLDVCSEELVAFRDGRRFQWSDDSKADAERLLVVTGQDKSVAR